MSPRADKLLEEVLSLPTDEQGELIDRLLEAASSVGIRQHDDLQFTAELERRHTEFMNDPAVGVPWDEVLRKSQEG